MLEIKNISKIYETVDLKQTALDKVSINFRASEFVAILGPSGSGKTTLLNIIGGLDHYTTGDLEINGGNVTAKASGEAAMYIKGSLAVTGGNVTAENTGKYGIYSKNKIIGYIKI